MSYLGWHIFSFQYSIIHLIFVFFQGDSGGPIMCLKDMTQTWYQVALVSRGYLCNTTEYPTVMARVSSHIDFVKSFTQNGKFVRFYRLKSVFIQSHLALPQR